MATIFVNGKKASNDPIFNAYATLRFTQRNEAAARQFSDIRNPEQRLSLTNDVYLRLLRDFQVYDKRGMNQLLRSARRFARTPPQAAPILIVNGCEVPNDHGGLAQFILREQKRAGNLQPQIRDGRIVVWLTREQYDLAVSRFTSPRTAGLERLLSATTSRRPRNDRSAQQANRSLDRQDAHPQRHHTARPQQAARRVVEEGRVVYEIDQAIVGDVSRRS